MITLIIIAIGLAIAVMALSIALKKKNKESEDLNSEFQKSRNNFEEMVKQADYWKYLALHPKVTKELTQFIKTDDTPQAIYDRTERLLAAGYTYRGTIDREHLLIFTQNIEVGPSNENKATE